MNEDKKTALVTGATSGIGGATARLLLEKGFAVIGTGRNTETLQADFREFGSRFFSLELDVNEPLSVSSLFDRLPPRWHDVDVLVNNAGHDVGGRRRFDEGEVEKWLRIIDTNVAGVVRVTHQIIKSMVEKKSGHIINVGSVAGLRGYQSGTLYSASKHAVHGFSESLRLDYEGLGIRVTEILPGLVKTQFAANRFGYQGSGDDSRKKAESFYQQSGKWLIPEDIANVILFALTQPPHVTVSQLVVVPS